MAHQPEKPVVPKGIEWTEYWAKGISSANMQMALSFYLWMLLISCFSPYSYPSFQDPEKIRKRPSQFHLETYASPVGKTNKFWLLTTFGFFLINTRDICLNSCGTRATDYTSEETSSFDLFTADFFIPLLLACSMKHLCFGNHSVVRC